MDTDGAGDDAYDVPGELPVLLVQTMNAFAIVSQEPRIRMKISSVFCFVARVSMRVTMRGRPSGVVVTTGVTEMMSMCIKSMPFLLEVLWR